jgi:hypothetical protein
MRFGEFLSWAGSQRQKEEKHMKSVVSIVSIASTVIALCSAQVVMAQVAGPSYDSTIHQSAGDRDSRGTPKYYQRSGTSDKRRNHHATAKHLRSTVGAGTSVPPSGPFYDNSIHQSAGGRDSRGTPKYCPGGRC